MTLPVGGAVTNNWSNSIVSGYTLPPITYRNVYTRLEIALQQQLSDKS